MGGILGSAGDLLFGKPGKNNYSADENVRDPERVGSAAGNVASLGYASAAQAGDRVGPQADMARTNMAMRDADQMRTQQQGATALLQDAALGNAPSVAQLQMQQGQENALRANLAMANSGQGGAGAALMAARQAGDRQVQMSGQAVQDTAMLRAQEMAQARGALSGHLSGMRGNDLATAGVQQQGALAQQQAALQAQAQNDALLLGAGNLALGGMSQVDNVALQNNDQLLRRDLGVAGIDAGVATANANAEMQRQLGLMGAVGGGIEAYMMQD